MLRPLTAGIACGALLNSKLASQIQRWVDACPLVPDAPWRGSWCQWQQCSSGIKLWCKVCKAGGLEGAYGKQKVNMKKIGMSNLKIHHRSRVHVENTMAYLHSDANFSVTGAPTVEDFFQVYDLVALKGAAADKGLRQVGRAKKIER